MAIGVSTNFKIYQEQYNGGFVEKQQQNVAALQGGSAGAFKVTGEYLRGDYRQESFFKKGSTLVSRRDPTSVSTATDIALTQDENVTVKLHRSIGPVAQTLSAWKQIGDSAERMSFVFGGQSADDVLAEKLNTSISATAAAIVNFGSTLIYDNTGASTKTISHTVLAKGLGKFGDQSERIVAWVMHPKVYFDLLNQAIADNVFGIGGIVIKEATVPALNRPVIVTESTALISPTSPSDYYTLGLVADAVDITDSEVPQIESQLVTGLANLAMRIQGEYAYNLGVRGFKWNISGGGANPDSSTVSTGSNWTQAYADRRELAGIVIITT
jgi:hypothetical protein